MGKETHTCGRLASDCAIHSKQRISNGLRLVWQGRCTPTGWDTYVRAICRKEVGLKVLLPHGLRGDGAVVQRARHEILSVRRRQG